MTAAGIREYGRRLVVLSIAIAGLSLFGLSVVGAIGLLVLAIVTYAALPQVRRPAGALAYSRMTAVVMPDLIGCLLGGFLLVLPLWMAREDPGRWGLVHPAIWLTGLPAVIALSILIHSANRAAWFLVIERDGLRIATAFGERAIGFADITRVEPYRRGLPRWLTGLVPLLAASGAYTAAGSIQLARDTTGLRLCVASGKPVVIEKEGFEQPFKQVREALARRGETSGPQDPTGRTS